MIRNSRMRAAVVPALALAVLGCQVPVSQSTATQAPSLALDVMAFEQAIADSPVVDWSSNTFVSEAIQHAREARGQRLAGYKVNYTSFAAPAWTRSHTGMQVANAPAFSHANVYASGPGPRPGDRLMYMTNAPRGINSFFIVDPTNGDPLNGTGWDVLTAVGAPGGAKVDGSAITLSALGTQAMFVTTGAYFGSVIVRPGTTTATAGTGVSLGTGRRVVNGAPFVDNSKYPGIDSRMSVWVATTNNTDSVGQLHNLQYASDASPAWSAPSTFTVSGPAADGTAGTVTAAGFKCSPVVWRGKVYIGDVNGRFWEYAIASNTARYWDLSPFSGVATDQIIAPAAFDIGGNGNADKLFVACGTRVFWIDPISNTVTPSQSLLLDTATSTPGPDLQSNLDGYTYAGSNAGDLRATESWSMGSDFNPGNTSYGNEIVGSYGYQSPTDGRPVTGYVRFDVPNGHFSGVPISATLYLTCDPYQITNTSDVGSIFRCSNFLRDPVTGLDTTTVWTATTPTASRLNRPDGWRRQPRLLVDTPFSSRNGPVYQNQQYAWNISGAVPRDNEIYTFAIRGQDKQYTSGGGVPANQIAPGYYGAEYGTVSRRPLLRVRCSSYGMNGAIKAQPILLWRPTNPLVYVANSNGVFELNYQSAGTFLSATETYFSLTASGRGGAGNVGVVSSSKFVQNQVTTALGRTGSQYYLYVCDENGAGQAHLNKFSVPLNRTANSDSLQQVYNMTAASLRTTPYIVWDYAGGSLYFGDQGATSRVTRLQQ